MPMIKTRFVIPNAFTSLNFLLGIWAICWTAGAFTPHHPNDVYAAFRMSANFVIFCALLDKLDGFAARLFKASSEFGAQFDSLADLVAFGLAPAFGFFFAYKHLAPSWFENHTAILVVALSVYVLCSAMRLAKYNAMDSDSYPDYFVGMPTTFAGAINSVSLILLCNYGFWEIPGNRLIHLPIVLLVGTAILMVSPLFLPKVKRRQSKLINAIQMIAILITYIVGFAMVFPEYLMAELVVYFTFGFGYGLLRKDEIIQEQEKKVQENASEVLE
ncbi:MAG TPA: CDP-alcohol phosphatidyltransferase family protein [Fibrobacteraceae bacterium]|nr:CDP-alcohol phosphatidyltransferase family protein [Fibrobacteraceae bacterium]